MSNHFSKNITVKNRDGIHARPSVAIVEVANQFSSDIYLQKPNRPKVNGKSILDILTLAACYGTDIIVEATGDDAQEAVETIVNLISKEFNFPRKLTAKEVKSE